MRVEPTIAAVESEATTMGVGVAAVELKAKVSGRQWVWSSQPIRVGNTSSLSVDLRTVDRGGGQYRRHLEDWRTGGSIRAIQGLVQNQI